MSRRSGCPSSRTGKATSSPPSGRKTSSTLYAVLHCPTYRSRYAQFLKTDFPRVPLTSNLLLFRALVAKGAELVSLHLLEPPAEPTTTYPVPGANLVESGYPRYDGRDRVSINPGQYFDGVPLEVWDFHVGGYQVADKWLKDRRGRTLTYDDLVHYQRVIAAMARTGDIMSQIDALIPSWPIP